jgi:hypothetical protein
MPTQFGGVCSNLDLLSQVYQYLSLRDRGQEGANIQWGRAVPYPGMGKAEVSQAAEHRQLPQSGTSHPRPPQVEAGEVLEAGDFAKVPVRDTAVEPECRQVREGGPRTELSFDQDIYLSKIQS